MNLADAPNAVKRPPPEHLKSARELALYSLVVANRDADVDVPSLYFFPDRPVSEARARLMLAGSVEERAEVISHLLRYAEWDDIWSYVSREEVREIFTTLDLPESLRAAWGRMLKVEAVVS